MEIETFRIEDAVKFLQDRDNKVAEYEEKYPLDQENKRAAFQGEILELLEHQSGFQLLGDIRYKLQPGEKDRIKDWRARDINRLLTRYQQDRPIEDARRLAEEAQRQARDAGWWAKWAFGIALAALSSALVSAVNDAPGAWSNLRWLVGI
jgi:hypothetical protein